MTIVLSLSEYVFGEFGVWGHWREETITGILYAAQTMTLLVPLFIFTKLKYKNEWNTFGFHKVKILTILKRIAQGYLFYYLASAIFLQIKMSFQTEIPGYGEQASHIPLFGGTDAGVILGGVIIVLIAPLVEELFFRGYIHQVLKKYTNVLGGSIGSALIFTLFHFEFQVFIPIFILGLVLSWLFERTGSIWTPICFHMLNNGLAFLIEVAIFYEWIQTSL
ncbi:CPBP family intramembrane metalloprotease [Candidatus Peregrinibacteria bacterium]|nr:CPBP family intramembrane metalloprotease [Candidatus Peregrinibacteria bacterium]